jgi:hypothetical protein
MEGHAIFQIFVEIGIEFSQTNFKSKFLSQNFPISKKSSELKFQK